MTRPLDPPPTGDAARGLAEPRDPRRATYLGLALPRLAARLPRAPGAAGYAVVGHRRTTAGRRLAIVADLGGPAGEVRGLLRRRCLPFARRGAAVLALPAPEQRGAFASLGFVPTPMSLHFMGKALAGRLNPDPRAWRFTLGDTDFF